jgi:hypothetical protein
LKGYPTSLSFWYNITIELNRYSKQTISAFQPNEEGNVYYHEYILANFQDDSKDKSLFKYEIT